MVPRWGRCLLLAGALDLAATLRASSLDDDPCFGLDGPCELEEAAEPAAVRGPVGPALAVAVQAPSSPPAAPRQLAGPAHGGHGGHGGSGAALVQGLPQEEPLPQVRNRGLRYEDIQIGDLVLVIDLIRMFFPDKLPSETSEVAQALPEKCSAKEVSLELGLCENVLHFANTKGMVVGKDKVQKSVLVAFAKSSVAEPRFDEKVIFPQFLKPSKEQLTTKSVTLDTLKQWAANQDGQVFYEPAGEILPPPEPLLAALRGTRGTQWVHSLHDSRYRSGLLNEVIKASKGMPEPKGRQLVVEATISDVGPAGWREAAMKLWPEAKYYGDPPPAHNTSTNSTKEAWMPVKIFLIALCLGLVVCCGMTALYYKSGKSRSPRTLSGLEQPSMRPSTRPSEPGASWQRAGDGDDDSDGDADVPRHVESVLYDPANMITSLQSGIGGVTQLQTTLHRHHADTEEEAPPRVVCEISVTPPHN